MAVLSGLMVAATTGSVQAEPPISTWVDLPTFQFLIRKCSNAIIDVSPYIQHKKYFFGGGGLRGTIAYIYRMLQAGSTPKQLCNGWIGNINQFTQAGADKDLFIREGFTAPADKDGWDMLDSSFWIESQKAGGAAIEKVQVRNDELRDPFGALAAYHKGELLFINVPEEQFVNYRGGRRGGLTGNSKTALLLRWLRFSEDLPGITVTKDQWDQASEIVFDEIMHSQIETESYWIAKALKKEFVSFATPYGRETGFWEKWKRPFIRMGLAGELSARNYEIINGTSHIPLQEIFSATDLYESKLQFQLNGFNKGLRRTSFPKSYQSSEYNLKISPELARDYVRIATQELFDYLFTTPIFGHAADLLAGQPAIFSAYQKMEAGKDKSLFEKVFAQFLSMPAFESDPFWASIHDEWVSGTPLLSDVLVHRMAENQKAAQAGYGIDHANVSPAQSTHFPDPHQLPLDDFLEKIPAEQWKELDYPGVQQKILNFIRRKANLLVTKALSGDEKSFGRLSAGETLLSISELLSPAIFEAVGKALIVGDKSADRLAEMFASRENLWRFFAKKTSSESRLAFVSRQIGFENFQAALQMRATSDQTLENFFPPIFRRFLAEDSAYFLFSNEYMMAREAAFLQIASAIDNPNTDQSFAWKMVKESIPFRAHSGASHSASASIDLLERYSNRFGSHPSLLSVIDFLQKPQGFPSDKDFLIKNLITHPKIESKSAEGTRSVYYSIQTILEVYGLANQFDVLLPNFLLRSVSVRPTEIGFRRSMQKDCTNLLKRFIH
ncbi:MAG: hypothetical protein H7301_10180 [Cryobacterium sp.]|nr:hypothetical protein [Oligoflexia bacterium]